MIAMLKNARRIMDCLRRPLKPWVTAGVAVPMVFAGFLTWNAWNRPAVQTYDPDLIRTRVAILIDTALEKTNPWLRNLPKRADFDNWLVALRSEFRPYFNVLSTEFDSQLIFITQEFDAHYDDSGPLRDHSRQLALVSARSLLEEEKNRLQDPCIRREEVDKRLVRLPEWMLVNGR